MKKLFSILAAVLFAGSMMADVVTVSKTVEELATANEWANGTVCTPFALDEVITVATEATDANTGKYYTSGQQIRLYQTGAATITLTAAEGYTISSVKLTYASQNTGILVEAESGTAVPFENVQSATFTVGNSGAATNGQVRLTAFEVEYADGGEIVPPTPEPETNYYLVGSVIGWTAQEAYKLTANPAQEGEYMIEYTAAANEGIKVLGIQGETQTWYKDGMGNEYIIAEAGDYTIYFRPAGNSDWDYEYIYAALKEDPIVPPVVGNEIIFTREDFLGQGTANTGSEVSATKGGVTFTYSKGYCADESLRCYAHGALSITSAVEIATINFTTTGGKTGGLDAEVTVNATSYVVEDLASQARFTEVKVVLAGGTTAIDNNEVEMKAVKRVVNGQLFIEKNGVLYNAQGAVVR